MCKKSLKKCKHCIDNSIWVLIVFNHVVCFSLNCLSILTFERILKEDDNLTKDEINDKQLLFTTNFNQEVVENSEGSLLDVELVEVGVLVELLEPSSGNPSSLSIVTGVSAKPASSQG